MIKYTRQSQAFKIFYTHIIIIIYILQYSGYFYGIILAPGLVYGQGEHMLKYIYKMVFSDTEPLLVPKEDNNLPIIHVENLAKLIITFTII